jgi:type III pantothenate kinase
MEKAADFFYDATERPPSSSRGGKSMLLTVGIGNSNIVAGIWNGDCLERRWRMHTVAEKTEDEYGTIFRSLFGEAGIDPRSMDAVCLSSVVPSLTGALDEMLRRLTGRGPIVLGPDMYGDLPIKVVNPYEIGADLVADAMAAWDRCRSAFVVVDFGTALTFTVVDASGAMLGVSIAPGLGTAVAALSRDTAQLPFVQLSAPPEPFGRNTVHSIQAGVVYGFTGLVEYLIARIRAAVGGELKTIATGGQCGIVAPLTEAFDFVEPDLTLYGLKLIAERRG